MLRDARVTHSAKLRRSIVVVSTDSKGPGASTLPSFSQGAESGL